MPLVGFSLLTLALFQPAPLGSGDHERTLVVDSLKRTYWVHVPPHYDANKATPVVLALHGATMTAKVMEYLTGLNEKADAAGFIVVYPNGTGPSTLLYTWNCGGFSSFFGQSKPNDVVFISRVLDDLEKVVNVDKKRVYATGMSNGAMMCYRLASELSERIAAIAPVSGTIAIENYQPRCPMPVLHIHGTVDSLVPYEGASQRTASFLKFRSVEDTIAACIKSNGCASVPKASYLPCIKDSLKITRKEYQAGPAGAEVVLYVVDGGGHTWPGSPIGGGILGAYTLNMRANDVIWEFFRRHHR